MPRWSIAHALRRRWPNRHSLVLGLVGLAEELTANASFDERMTRLCRSTAELLGCDRSSLFLLEEGYYRARFNHGNPPDVQRAFPRHLVRPDDPLVAEAMRAGGLVVVDRADHSPLMDARTARIARIRSIVLALLRDPRRGAVGFLTAEYNENPGRFGRVESSLVLGLAGLAGLVLRLEEAQRTRLDAEQEAARLQERLRALERLDSLGRLSSGLAHDLNNILTVILGHCELASSKGSGDPGLAHSLGQIEINAQRAADFTQQLLAFGRSQVLQPRIVDLNAVVDGVLPMLQGLLPANVELRVQPAKDLGRVRADPRQMEQVVLNLVLNARDAMPEGGILTLETANVLLQEDHARSQPGVRPGPHVRLGVTDTGSGGLPGDPTRVFEPFYTTKSHGKGTGLGLSTVYGIAKQSGGSVWADGATDSGTTFWVDLPRVEGEPKEPSPTPRRVPSTGDETVLVVDPDPGVREIARLALEAEGYTALDAGNGRTALEISRAHPGPIHLLLTDAQMSDMSASELAGALLQDRPGVRVLYLSGHAENAASPGTPLLAKPFSPSRLCQGVREILGPEREA